MLPRRRKPPEGAERTALVVEAELATARTSLESQERALAEAKAAYEAALDIGAGEALAARPRMTEAEVGREVAARLVERLAAELKVLLEGARTAAEAAARTAAVAAAVQAAEQYQRDVEGLLPDLIRAARVLVRSWALAEAARVAARQIGADVPGVDDFRAIPGQPRQVLSREERSLWVNPHGRTPFGDEDQKRVRQDVNGSGLLSGSTHTFRSTERQPWEIVTSLPASAPRFPDALPLCLRVPGMTPDDAPGWEPSRTDDPAEILQLLDLLEAPRPREEPRPEVQRRPLGPPVSVVKPGTRILIDELRGA